MKKEKYKQTHLGPSKNPTDFQSVAGRNYWIRLELSWFRFFCCFNRRNRCCLLCFFFLLSYMFAWNSSHEIIGWVLLNCLELLAADAIQNEMKWNEIKCTQMKRHTVWVKAIHIMTGYSDWQLDNRVGWASKSK